MEWTSPQGSFLQGLKAEILTELAGYVDQASLYDLTDLAIHLDNLLYS